MQMARHKLLDEEVDDVDDIDVWNPREFGINGNS